MDKEFNEFPDVRIFWPTDSKILKNKPSLVVGFQNSISEFVVIGIFLGINFKSMQDIINDKLLFMSMPLNFKDKNSAEILSKLKVLGTINCDIESNLPLRIVYESANVEDLSVSGSSLLNNLRISLAIKPAGDCDIQYQIVLYERLQPRKLRYYSFQPITLELADRNASFCDDDGSKNEEQLTNHLNSRLQLHKVSYLPLYRLEDTIHTWLDQINMSFELSRIINEAAALKVTQSTQTSGVLGKLNACFYVIATKCYSMSLHFLSFINFLLTWILVGMVIIYRVLSEIILVVVEWSPNSKIYAFKDVSATVQQLDLRLQQACYWPIQYISLRSQKRTLMSSKTFHSEYIRFYNSLWLVANDIIIGAAVGAYIIENREFFVFCIDYCIKELLTTGLRRNIEWLMDWPGGLKLNNELVAFFGELFLWVIGFWEGILENFRPYLSDIVYFVGVSGFFGATFPIALVADIVSFLTIQIYSCYLASARIYNWQLTVLLSLFHLFRGKRRNVLRNRIDSCDYDLDQLLIGTILFTLLTFLLPTVLVFYLSFATARLLIIVINAVLESSLALLNHFPLFAIMLRSKDSKRLPGGIEFDLVNSFSISKEKNSVVVMKLKPKVLPITSMFQQYLLLSKRIQRHYLSLRVILLLLTGQFVPIQRSRLYSLQYSMLPENRIPIYELWSKLSVHTYVARTDFMEKWNLLNRN
ncbi:N-acetylglucosaminyl transferase component-domain-containing protein [Dipodascopsis uninucleata]